MVNHLSLSGLVSTPDGNVGIMHRKLKTLTNEQPEHTPEQIYPALVFSKEEIEEVNDATTKKQCVNKFSTVRQPFRET